MNSLMKFRAWDTVNERMVQDPYRFEPFYEYHITGYKWEGDHVFYEDWQDDRDGIERPCFLMQSTGKKDKNGTEIFKGDILKCTYGMHYWESIVDTLEGSTNLYAFETFHNCTRDDNEEFFTYQRSDSRSGHRNDVNFLSKTVEVIGNIYENPELLNP